MRKNVLAALAALALCGSAHAYRPFDGTDAAVADPGSLEIELGAGRAKQGEARVLSVPALVATYGLGHGNEIGIEAHRTRESDGLQLPYRTRIEDSAINFKRVLREGSLQDKAGPSVATECSLLFPGSGGSGSVGAGCTALVSQQWDALTGHFNVGLERTPEGTTTRSFSLMAEGPESWPVRPGTELRWEADNAGGWDHTVLAALLIPHGKDLTLDLGWRVGQSSDGAIHEVRVGLTWAFGVRGGRKD
jgi:hypothetical protein